MYKEFDRHDGVKPKKIKGDRFDLYRKKSFQKSFNPRSRFTSKENPKIIPSVKRNYLNPKESFRRYKARDLADNGSDGSLWSNDDGKNNFLFTESEKKNNGDIILIKVAGKLKNEITAELKRAFPSKRKTSEDGNAETKKSDGSQPEKPSGDKNVDASTDKVYDQISSIVIEEIKADHLLLRGRKSVLYKNRKRTVEVQALVARRDIQIDDTINSNKILESQIMVVR